MPGLTRTDSTSGALPPFRGRGLRTKEGKRFPLRKGGREQAAEGCSERCSPDPGDLATFQALPAATRGPRGVGQRLPSPLPPHRAPGQTFRSGGGERKPARSRSAGGGAPLPTPHPRTARSRGAGSPAPGGGARGRHSPIRSTCCPLRGRPAEAHSSTKRSPPPPPPPPPGAARRGHRGPKALAILSSCRVRGAGRGRLPPAGPAARRRSAPPAHGAGAPRPPPALPPPPPRYAALPAAPAAPLPSPPAATGREGRGGRGRLLPRGGAAPGTSGTGGTRWGGGRGHRGTGGAVLLLPVTVGPVLRCDKNRGRDRDRGRDRHKNRTKLELLPAPLCHAFPQGSLRQAGGFSSPVFPMLSAVHVLLLSYFIWFRKSP